jgi:hypothetical protein
MSNLKKLLLVGLFATSAVYAENRYVVNGLYQIPVQTALALQQIKYDLFEGRDWNAEAILTMKNTLADIEKGQVAAEVDVAGTSGQLMNSFEVTIKSQSE